MMKNLVLFLCVVLIGLLGTESQLSEDENPVVSLKQGQAKGKILKSTHGITFNAFLGIPYGNVKKRFTSPEPAGSWDGILDATKDGPVCKQYDAFFRHATLGQEDGCLVLNVYTPNLPKDNLTTPIPVMVFIYGGGFVMGEGSSSVYGPGLYMNKDVVLVLMNYRVGPLGFLSTGDEESPGNYGLLDQVLALRWVKENIENFGGDPNRVTISGESAGGASVVFHLLSPLSKGLFHGAIAQSGSALCPWALQADPLGISQKIAQKVDCPIDNTTVMIECLRKVDADVLSKASHFNDTAGSMVFTTVPVVENPINGQFLTESPLKILSEGRFHKVPVISGVMADEGALLALSFLSGSGLLSPKNFTENDWNTFIKVTVDFAPGSTKLSNPETVQAIRKKYFENVNFENTSKDFILRAIQVSTDANFKMCNEKTVRLLAAGGVPVYTYVWDYAIEKLSNVSIGGKPAAYHGMDLFFLFNGNLFGFGNYTIDDVQEFSDRVLDLWTNFTAVGDPTPSGTPVKWTPNPVGSFKYLNITTEMAMEDGDLPNNFKFWDDILYK